MDVPSVITIKQVRSKLDIQKVVLLATTIWNEFYVPFIGEPQVEYMLSKIQSTVAISQQINEDKIEYYLVYKGTEEQGYFAIKQLEGEIFLSKFYLRKQSRGIGLGRVCLMFIAEKGRSNGSKLIRLVVNKISSSVKIYEKMGFINDGPLLTVIGDGYFMDDYKMSYKIEAK